MREKSYAKVNIFLKITGTKEHRGLLYHTFHSRFMLVKNLYDTIEFVPQKCDSFTIEGIKDVALKDNLIYKAYQALNRATGDLDILEFFYNHKVVVKKNIPFGAGLGGGSSNAATFMRMVNKQCNLKLTSQQLASIGANIGADIPFFLYGYPSANVSGFGEIIEPFNEEPLDLTIITPPIHCDTGKVYGAYKEHFLKDTTAHSGATLMLQKSSDILDNFKEPTELNDLYKAALLIYPQLQDWQKEDYYFSGSGSSFFTRTKQRGTDGNKFNCAE